MKEKTAQDITLGVVLVAIALTIMLLCGCVAPQCVGNGVHQEGYWWNKAKASLITGDTPGAQGAVDKGLEINTALKTVVPKPNMEIDADSHYVIKHQIDTYNPWWSQLIQIASGYYGFSPGLITTILSIFGTGGVGYGLLRLVLETRKRKKAEEEKEIAAEAATDMSQAIEDLASVPVQERVAEYQKVRGYLPKQGSVDMFRP